MSSAPTPAQTRGALTAALCYFLWGLVPLYWTQLAAVNAVELIAHRYVWSLLILLVLLAVRHDFAAVRSALRTPRGLGQNLVAALLLTSNWLVYVWGVNTGHVIECSLGYFLVPLVNVATGRFVLHEHLRPAQWLAIALAASGVLVMIFQLGRVPWIALIAAGSWGGYSLMRKRNPLGVVTGLAIETLLLVPFALAFIAWLAATGSGALGHADMRTHLLLLGTGIVTMVPLLLFAYSAKRIRLSTLGLLQYIAPSVQLVLGIWFYREPFARERAFSFGIIWAALALYTADNLLAQRRPAAA